MRNLAAIFLFLICSLASTYGQRPKPPQRPPNIKGADDNCIYKAKYNLSQRLHFYPFNAANTIKLVSFRYQGRNNYPIKRGLVNTDSLIEERTLNISEVAGLTDILYNNFYIKSSQIDVVTQCFFPRNAILFIDKNGTVKEYVLICFHCSNLYGSSEKIRLGDECDQKMELIRKFFIKSKVVFGTDLSIDRYPGEQNDELQLPPNN